MRVLATTLIAFAIGGAGAASAETLTVYTYESFTSEWGPGPEVAEAFEAECGCTLEWVSLDDAGLLLSRLRLEGENTEADVVLGLDTNLMAEARATGLLAPHEADLGALDLPVAWDDDTFVPFDYGWFAVVWDTQALDAPPASLEDLVENPDGPRIVIQDPRTSTPGLGLLLWIKAVYGDEAPAAWESLSQRVLTVTKGWSEAYGLFLDGEAPMVLSYQTSPAYHIIAEDTDRYRAAMFPEGHYLQVEVAAMTRASGQPALAREFLQFIATEGFQQAIPTGNWMYPAIALDDMPAAFAELPRPDRTLTIAPEAVAENRKAWIDEWLAAASR